MGLIEQTLHGLVDLHFLYLLGTHRAQLAVRDELGLLFGEIGVFITQLESSLIVLVDHIIKEQRQFLKAIGSLLRGNTHNILAVRDEQ